MSTTTLPRTCPAWCRTCLFVGNNSDACHESEVLIVTDPNPETPDVFAAVSIERLDRDGTPGTPRVRIETGDQALSLDGWDQVHAAVRWLRTQIRD